MTLSSLTLDQLRALTDLDEIRRQLSLVEQEEIQLDNELDRLLEDGKKFVQAHVQTLETLEPTLDTLAAQTATIRDVVEKTAHLSENISVQVKSIDQEQQKVQAAIQQVEDAQQLKNCITGVQQALKVKDYENAAVYIEMYLEFNRSINHALVHDIVIMLDDDTTNDVKSATVRDATAIMKRAKQETLQICLEQFSEAAGTGQDDVVLRFWKLFPKLGEPELGLEKLCEHLCSTIRKSFPIPLNMGEKGGPTFVDIATQLFELLAKVIDKQDPMVQQFYGPGRMLYVIRAMEKESDFLSMKIISTFIEKRAIERRMSDIEGASRPMVKPNEEKVKVDLREIALITDEISLLAQRMALFRRFLIARVDAALAELDTVQKKDALVQKLLESKQQSTSTEVSRKMRELLSTPYVNFESLFLAQSIAKALRMDEYDSKNEELISSCVEDSFFIFKKVVSRALLSQDTNTICVALNLVNRTIECDYFRDGLQRRILSAYGGEKAFGLQDRTDAKVGYMILLNDLDVSMDYLEKLCGEVQDEMTRLSLGSKDKEKVESCLAQFRDAQGHFKSLLRTCMDNLFQQTLRQRLQKLQGECFAGLKYQLSEDEYALLGESNGLAKRFTSGMDRLLADGYQRYLTASNFTSLVQMMTEFFTREWERLLFKTQGLRFNGLGALCLDRDVRFISSHLSALIKTGSVRDPFARLVQIALLVNMESAAEISEYYPTSSDGRIQWRLTLAEVKMVLAARFGVEEVKKLRL